MNETGRFIGVGVGPGDPELLTLKAVRLIRTADVICYLANRAGESQARHIARDALAESDKQQQYVPLLMPMSEDRTMANQVYDSATVEISTALTMGKSVVFLCEGDPLFFGSFAYMLERLNPERVGGHSICEVVPGISSVNAASAALQKPLTVLTESFSVVSGRHSLEQLTATLCNSDSVVIMKAGLSRPKILSALRQTDRINDAAYLEYIGRDNQRIETDVGQLADTAGPYFSLFVVTRSNRNTT